jgi:hypothetical protein
MVQRGADGVRGSAVRDLGAGTAGVGGMMTVLIVTLAIVAAGLITELVAANHAPFGYQDEAGFHFGPPTPGSLGDWELENPS